MPGETPSLIELSSRMAPPPRSSNKRLYAAVVVPTYARYRLGKDASGALALLIRLDGGLGRFDSPPIRLQHLHVAHSLDCEIQRDGSVESGLFTVISCVDADRPMEVYFLRVLQALLPTLGDDPSPQAINIAVDHLVELFQALRSPPRKTAQGLWAELLVIAESGEPTALIDAWHTMPEDLYDFNSGAQRLEVKSTSGQMRRHHFSLAQLQPPAGTTLVVASVIANRAGAGATVTSLVEEIGSRLATTPERLLRLYKVVALTLGDGWRESTLEAFDRQAARQALAFFEPSQIPRISPPLPQGVSNVHFTSDLTGKVPLTLGQLEACGGLVSMLRPGAT